MKFITNQNKMNTLNLKSELLTIEPELVVVVGDNALKFFLKDTNLTDAILAQKNGTFQKRTLNNHSFELLVVPHPSRRSRLWNTHSKELIETFITIRKEIQSFLP